MSEGFSRVILACMQLLQAATVRWKSLTDHKALQALSTVLRTKIVKGRFWRHSAKHQSIKIIIYLVLEEYWIWGVPEKNWRLLVIFNILC